MIKIFFIRDKMIIGVNKLFFHSNELVSNKGALASFVRGNGERQRDYFLFS